MSAAGEVRELLDERPDLEPALEAVLRPDPPFAFDDLDVDSGRFGELVSRGVVERADGGYRVADPETVRRALEGEVLEPATEPGLPASLLSIPLSRPELAYLAGAVALVVAFRLISLPTVYHEGYVVLSGNDPYYYRYLVDRLLTDPATTPGNLGFGVARGEPLLVTSLWFVSVLLGGTKAVAGHVMAWYPVVSAAMTAVLVYALGVVVTDDRRVGLASVAMLAVVPGHALRTSLGFADHEAFDYVWLALTLLGLALLARDRFLDRDVGSPQTVLGALLLAAGVAGQTLAWDNSPVLLVAVGGYLAVEGLRTVYAGERPARTLGPALAGLAVAAGLVWLAHSSLGWHTTLVASAPVLLAIGGAGVLAGAMAVRQLHERRIVPSLTAARGAGLLAALEVAGVAVGVLVLQGVRPEYWSRLTTGLSDRLLAPRPIVEVVGLFGEQQGWLLLLGFALFVAVPYLLWATLRAVEDGRWLPPVCYAWYFLALSAVQARFVGAFAIASVVFVGLGLVHVAERVDVARRPAPFTDDDPPTLRVPTPRQFGALAAVFLLVGSLGVVQVYTLTDQVSPESAQTDAAIRMAEYSDSHDLEYPANYVFSDWSRNRMFNYFVSGESRGYGFAESNYEPFVASTEPAAWYERLGEHRGFVVTTPEAVGEPDQLGTRLHHDGGFATSSSPALAHYRYLHSTGEGQYRVFKVVHGAVIQGTADPTDVVNARATVRADGRSYTYRRWTTPNSSGVYRLRVAHPGEYRVAGTTVTVNETAVNQGLTLPAGGAS